MLLIFSDENDIHSLTVLRKIRDRGEDALIIDTSFFPKQLLLDLNYNENNFNFSLLYKDEFVNLENVTGVWLRRLCFPNVPTELSNDEMRKFSYMQSKEAIYGWLFCFDNIINSLHSEFNASNKIYQLKIAQSVGLKIPRTIISNNEKSVLNFFSELNCDIIYKPLHSPHFAMAPTQALQKKDLTFLKNLIYGPSIFQEEIKASKHLRITIVENEIFVAEIKPIHEMIIPDWRVSSDYDVIPATIPDSEKNKLLLLHNKLGLRYGAADIILDVNGNYVFLETNPGGQYLFCEIHAGLAISDAIVTALLKKVV